MRLSLWSLVDSYSWAFIIKAITVENRFTRLSHSITSNIYFWTPTPTRCLFLNSLGEQEKANHLFIIRCLMWISPPSQYAWLLTLSKWKAEGARKKIHPKSPKEGAQESLLHLRSFESRTILQNSWNMTDKSPPDLVSRARGALYCFLWYSSIFFGFFFLVAPCLPLLIIHRRLYRYVLISTYLI